jgi:hypothetical protein
MTFTCDSKPLAAAVTGLSFVDYNYKDYALQAIQSFALSNWGETWDEADAQQTLDRLVEDRWIRLRPIPDKPANNRLESSEPVKPMQGGKYVAVPEIER